MPKIRPGMKKPPHDFEKINAVLDAFETQMKDAIIGDESKKVRKNQTTWEVASINYKRTRAVFDACVREKTISQKCLDYCCEMNFIDSGLVRRWRLDGYETLCCSACVQSAGKSGTCACRVPGKKLPNPCATCGCTGCASGSRRDDAKAPEIEKSPE
jgi:bud site selection protein 31